MQLRHHEFSGGNAFFFVNIRWDAAAIVFDLGGTIRIQRDDNTVTMSREGFVNGVIDNLVHHVVQARTVIGVPDIHARPLTHGVEAL